MRRTALRAWLALFAPLLLPVGLLLLLRQAESLDVFYRDADVHLVLVSVIAGCALLVALVAGRAGANAGHHGPVWLAMGCLSVGTLMLAHGLVTPGVGDRPMNLWVARLPYLSIACFALALGMASRARNAATSSLALRHPNAMIGGWAATMGAFGALLVADPTRWGGDRPVAHEDAILWAIAVTAGALLVVVAIVHWRRWRLGSDPVQYSLALAALLSAAALLSLRTGALWRLSWWDYHGFLLAAYAGAVYAVLMRYRRTRAVDQVLAATFDDDPMTHIADGYPEALRTLVRAVEVKDRYTHGHSERTARISVQLGTRLGLPADRLRALARGAYLHDVGKIAIPDAILNKPGALTAEERTVIETHPETGFELVSQATALTEALPVVLSHHERWDGAGYPNGLRGSEIPLVARIAAVADVWDALTSDRSYRAGIPPADALDHIVAGSGTHFEPAVVEAMVALAADWGYLRDGHDGDAEAAAAAAETCHDAYANTT
jgi:hypothetical protein